jgi:hypothetical protein
LFLVRRAFSRLDALARSSSRACSKGRLRLAAWIFYNYLHSRKNRRFLNRPEKVLVLRLLEPFLMLYVELKLKKIVPFRPSARKKSSKKRFIKQQKWSVISTGKSNFGIQFIHTTYQ